MKKIVDRLEFELLDFFVKVGLSAIVYGIVCWFLHADASYKGKMVGVFVALVVFFELADFTLIKIGIKRRTIC